MNMTLCCNLIFELLISWLKVLSVTLTPLPTTRRGLIEI